MTKNWFPFPALVAALLVPYGLMAQSAEAKKAEEPKKEAAKQEETQKKQEAAAASPAPSVEQNVSFLVDFGYRWNVNTAGNLNSYRSVVNLGEGPKIFGLDLGITDPKSLLFDSMDLRAHGWGSEPWETARMDARKRSAYNLSVDYRRLAYFNYLPSFANPNLALGSLISERSYDTHIRSSDVNLELLPDRWIRPFLNWNYVDGGGNGIINFVTDGNEYPVSNWIRNNTNVVRGGVYMQKKRWHLTLEQGGLFFRDDSQAYAVNDNNGGNRPLPVPGAPGQTLNNLQQLYGARGRSIFNRALFTANPFSWLDVTAGFTYSQPWTDATYIERASGRFFLPTNLSFYTGQQALTTANSKLPRSSGNAGAEIRPFRQMRILETWFTDRLHNASNVFLTEQLLLSGPTSSTTSNYLANRLVWNYSQQEVDVLYDLTPKVTLRGGHRYVWGDVSGYGGFLKPSPETAKLERHVGIAGVIVHASRKLHSSADLEVGRGDKTYFRTSIQNYTRLKIRTRFQAKDNLSVSVNYSLLDNKNPLITSLYDYQSQDGGASVLWSPTAVKRVSIIGEYSYFRLRSSVSYLDPWILRPMQSYFREQGHTGNAMLDFTGPKVGYNSMRLGLGGSIFTSGGSRPTDYYQPMVRLIAPFHRNVALRSEWRYYGMSQTFYSYEGFRSHLFLISLQVSR
jgi:hypothetical protein